jgi:hypothetical protein
VFKRVLLARRPRAAERVSVLLRANRLADRTADTHRQVYMLSRMLPAVLSGRMSWRERAIQ